MDRMDALEYDSFSQQRETVKLNIHDMGGRSTFGSLLNAFYRDVDGVLIVYDVTNSDSFDYAEQCVAEANMRMEDGEKVWKMLVANKYDLEEERQVPSADGLSLAEEFNMKFIECSAKTGHKVDALFELVGSYLLKEARRKQHKSISKANGCCCVLM